MKDAAAKAIGFAKGCSRQDLDQDELLRLALTKLLEIVGEAAKHVSPEHGPTCPTWHGPQPPLCRAHHRAKQAPGRHLAQPQPGVMTWTLPHGRSYTVRPDPYPA